MNSPDIQQVLLDLRRRANAFGMTALSEKTGIDRVHLYRVLAADGHGNCRLDTLGKITTALGVSVTLDA